PILQDDFRVRDQAGQWEAQRRSGLERFLEEGELRLLIEASASEVGLLRRRHLKLAAAQRRLHVDAGAPQLLDMLLSVLGREDMIGALAALEAVAHERQQRLVLLLRRAEKGADMPVATEHRAGKWNGCRGRVHGMVLPVVLP